MDLKKIDKGLLFSILFYLGINSLFLFKYGLRQDTVSVYLLIFLFNLLILSLFYLIFKTDFKLLGHKKTYFTIVLLYFIVSILINYFIDGANLNVDRWSAMQVSIDSIFHNIYPYSVTDHLNGRSSNLPGLIIIGIPFYLLKNIGLLQSFSFLLFAYTINKTITNPKAKLIGILLMELSISFLWEVYVKSDLMSNFIIVLSFVSLWYSYFKKDRLSKPILAGSIGSFLFFTRLVAIIPLTLLFLKAFIKSNFYKKILFLTASIITLSLLSLFVLKDLPSLDTFLAYNPFKLQNKQLPLLLSVVFIAFPFYYAFKKINSLKDIIKYATLFLIIPVLISFFISLYNYGFNEIIKNSAFDISYFNIPMPFLILFISLKLDEKLAYKN